MEGLKSDKVNNDDLNSLNKGITEGELWGVIKLCQANKAPDTDGLTQEFYLKFWDDVKIYLIGSIRESMNTKSLSTSQRQGILNLIPKDGKDLKELKNWRPLSLLNQDYKYIARLIAERIKTCLPNLISQDQNRFVPGRYIGYNIVRILNLIDKCNETNINGVLLNIDFEKAFDCVEWDFVYRALSFFGFPINLINMIKVLYQDISACVTNNGHQSEFFKLGRGVRQGCPLSPYLFVLTGQLLNLFIKFKSRIEGIIIDGVDYTISQFADDTSLAVICNMKNIENCFSALKKVQQVSGLKVNENKTEALSLGCGQKLPGVKIGWVETTTKILGVKIGSNRQVIIQENFAGILDRLKTKLNLWRQRNLSWFGKTLLLKTIGISQLVYLLTNLPSPDNIFMKAVEKTLFNLFWKGGPDRIKRETLYGPIEKGGLDFPKITCYNIGLKLQWVKRLIREDGPWKQYVISRSPFEGNKGIFYIFLEANQNWEDFRYWYKPNSNNIFTDIFQKWCQYNYTAFEQTCSKNKVLSESIWFNSNIKIRTKTIFKKHWYTCGLIHIKDLVRNNRWLTLLEITNISHNSINFLEYLSVLSAIPKEWHACIKNRVNADITNTLEIKSKLEIICNVKKPSSFIRRELAKVDCVPPMERIAKWGEELGVTIDTDEWLENFRTVGDTTAVTRLKSFSYRFQVRDVLTNNRLYKMKLSNTVMCYLCKQAVESISHLYWECEINKRLWERLKTILHESLGYNLALIPEVCLLELKQGGNKKLPPFIRQLLMLLKQYIHKCKCIAIPTNVTGFEQSLKGIIRLENIINLNKAHRGNALANWNKLSVYLKL